MGKLNYNEENLDGFIDSMLSKYTELLENGIPKAYALYKESRDSFLRGDLARAEKIKRLNYFLHNSEIPYTADIGKNTVFAYGGIGVIIHANALIGERANIGSNVTIGGDRVGVPTVGNDVFFSSGCKVIGNITINHGAIIGANSVVLTNVSAFEIVAGSPARVVGMVTRNNFERYSGYYWCKGNIGGEARFLDWYFPQT
ncbi:hypothetical protein LHU53_13220 [Rhodoferax sp. U2-2l]|uniref:serine O-acetyltransferase n=1 Tax=Rhodoferax sp. U2-2l TaxID=2884000 RepID=UPI001D0A81B3|nr:hypothetical protein [Rhodoferax sp. U2-2l]MCB8747866.1 hypothetical protein [Rhodoferax sp. U2-2l]